MKARSPNQEQHSAIIKKGGVLLSAGAGSGKTFVIIEHIVFILRAEHQRQSEESLRKNIKTILSAITLMTFTIKAAGEMSIRLTKRIEQLIIEENVAEKLFWELVYSNLSSIKILTIHGLCSYLLRSGYWPQFPLTINIVDKTAHRVKIKTLFDEWFELNANVLKPQFLAHTSDLLVGIEEIFNSPELRILWESPRDFPNSEDELNLFFKDWCALRNFELIFSNQFNYVGSPKKDDKKVFQAIIAFIQFKKTQGILSAKNFKNYLDFFSELGRFPSALKDMETDELVFRNEMKQLRDDMDGWSEDLLEMELNFKDYRDWASVVSSLFNFINKRYLDLPGFSFADLEYYVYRGLENTNVLNKIHESLNYFIVDEFQDTSYVQFDILRKLIGNNVNKLYAVGDRKQAIYGFRGGELQVFHQCEKLMGEQGNLSLKSNYRSKKNIVEFNNLFFKQIFPLGAKFEDLDIHHTLMEAQSVPEHNENATGEVYALRLNLANSEKIKDLDLLEAQILVDEIERLITEDTTDNICILYKKLHPSYYLIDLLKERELSFKAQIKISFPDDPVISIFKYLIELALNQADLKKSASSFFLLNSLGEILGLKHIQPVYISDFIDNSNIIGIENAFIKLFLNLGFTNSFFDLNFKLIFSLCSLAQNDFLKIYHFLKNNEDEYSTELISGKKQKQIYLMTAHASKGLEFDVVMLGGVHTNGGYLGMSDKIGKMPGSFRWKKSYDQKKFCKSPAYFLESEILKHKNFSESKRLLYVACTRAISKLCWADLRNIEAPLITDQNSWIKALRLADVNIREIQLKSYDLKKPKEISFLQKDNLGLLVSNNSIATGIISELSVTRLATLAECPFKFYLKNICKINSTEKFYLESDEEEPAFYSSKERGTKIHHILSQLFKLQTPIEKIPNDLIDLATWVSKEAEKFKDFECFSETAIKFSFFNNMISGTPDLYFLKSENNLAVWDFKTGTRNQKNESAYWFQLMCYAYGIGKIYPLLQHTEIEMNLIYVDQKINISKKLSWSSISLELFTVWKKTESLYQVNKDHCTNCEYSTICKNSQP